MALPGSGLTHRWQVLESAVRRFQLSRLRFNRLLLVPIILVALIPAQGGWFGDGQLLRSPAFAHTVKVSGEVAATFHIEPNHKPRAGKPSLTWFVLTRKGGTLIPFSQCNCQVVVYTLPRPKNAPPLLRPVLQAVNVEHHQAVPGTEIIFPKPGQYQIVISGSPKPPATFKPFTLSYTVVVSRGN